jgi:hypothetical protein
MKRTISLIALAILLVACSPSQQVIQTAVAGTLGALPSQTPLYPTYKPAVFINTVIVTRVVVQTPTFNSSRSADCIPITNMVYSDNSTVAILLQAYVSQLPDVKAVSYTIPEKIYSNSLSEIFFVQYTSTDGKNYAKRYVVYMDEFGWQNGTFSLDGQCWIDPPK